MTMISVIIPCYNEESTLRLLHAELIIVAKQMKEVDFEFILVDDGSSDRTLAISREFAAEDCRFKYLSFSRNFGKEAAMYAGFENATGDYIALMDADLQDPPHLLPEMYGYLIDPELDYDSVATRRVSREGEPAIRSFFARSFYKLMSVISNVDIQDGARDYRLMNRKFVIALLAMGEYNRFSKGIFGWVGYKTKWLAYKNIERVAGETKWSFWKLVSYSITGIVSFSTLPLTIAFYLGIILCSTSFLLIAAIVTRSIICGSSIAASGWPSLMCVILLIGGLQLFCLGILGEYFAKAYLEIKKRPIYILRDSSIKR